MRAPWLLALLGTLSIPGGVHAACIVVDHLDTWPAPGARLPAGGRIVLTGTPHYRDHLGDLAERPPTLVSDRGERVGTRVTAYPGAGRSQVVVTPERPLAPGHWYRLETARPLAGGPLAFGPPGEGPPLAWWSGSDEAPPPRWLHPPRAVHFEDQPPCPQALYFEVETPVTPGARVRVRLQPSGDTDRAEAWTFIAPVHDGRIRIGTSCSIGQARLARGTTYLARLEAVDVAGRVRPWPDPLVLEVPAERGTSAALPRDLEALATTAWPGVQSMLQLVLFMALMAAWLARPVAPAPSRRARWRRRRAPRGP